MSAHASRLNAWRACVLLAGLCAGAGAVGGAQASDAAPAAAFSKQESAQLDRAVRDVCRKDIVLLGEDSDHGSGRTLAIKVELVRRLATRCGFRGIVFESSLYASLELERRLAAGDADEDAVRDAAGQLWFRADEAQPMTRFLLEQARAGRLRIGGMDMQPVVLPGRYTQSRLADDVAAVLDVPRRDACAEELRRHTNWQYDDASPFDDAAQQRLRGCIDAMRAAADAQPTRTTPEIARSIVGLSQYMAMAADGGTDVRDRAMFDNLMWYRDRWPKGTRILVWCATVHAAKTLSGFTELQHPLGGYVHARFGDRAAAIGFSALGGHFGTLSVGATPMTLSELPQDALEVRTLADSDDGLRYVDRRTLAKAGTASARALTYRRTYALPWAQVLDGLIVLREEKPTTRAAR